MSIDFTFELEGDADIHICCECKRRFELNPKWTAATPYAIVLNGNALIRTISWQLTCRECRAWECTRMLYQFIAYYMAKGAVLNQADTKE